MAYLNHIGPESPSFDFAALPKKAQFLGLFALLCAAGAILTAHMAAYAYNLNDLEKYKTLSSIGIGCMVGFGLSAYCFALMQLSTPFPAVETLSLQEEIELMRGKSTLYPHSRY